MAATAGDAPAARLELKRIGSFHGPVYVTAPPGDGKRVFVVERAGRVRLIRDGHRVRRPFIDIRREVFIKDPHAENDHRGLLSLAFAPDHERSRLLYVAYTNSADNLRVESMRTSARNRNVVDWRTRREVLSVPLKGNFDFGGHIAFGPDGMLYIGLGFGTAPVSESQDLGSLRGKLLRLDPRPDEPVPYRIPPDNPYAAGQGGARPEIYASGLRNPWRFSFDRVTGDLAIGDVGESAFEEIDFVPRGRASGANFGWDRFEGNHRRRSGDPPGYVPPVMTHARSEHFCAVIGGHVVRDRGLGRLYGRYLYGDLCTGQIRSAKLGPAHASSDRRESVRVDGGYLVSFGEDARGRIYVVRLAGQVYRLVRR
jgi:glucose/arabinose dehydrogenase